MPGSGVSRFDQVATRRQCGAVEQRKPSALLSGSVVTDIDLHLKRAIDDALDTASRTTAPGRGGRRPAPVGLQHGRTWVVDPIDGTLNYARRVGPWSFVVSLARPPGRIRGGWTGGSLLTAAAGRGATCNGRRPQLAAHAEPGGVVRA